MNIVPKRTDFRSPWQNGVAKRFVGNCRRDLPDHVIALNERHLKRLMTEHICRYDNDRTHLGLDKETPNRRSVAPMNTEVRWLAIVIIAPLDPGLLPILDEVENS
jgi:transposase InsO family protein